MAFDLPTVAITPPSGPARKAGFLDLVEWVDDAELAKRALTASESQCLNREVLLSPYVLDGTKVETPSPAFTDNFTYTAYLRRQFSAGEATRAEAEAIARKEFDDALESNITRAVLAGVTITAMAPSTTFKVAVGMLDRAGAKATGGRAAFMLFAPTASSYLADLSLADETPAGTKIVISAGATPLSEYEALATPPTVLKGYVFGQPYGTRTTPLVTSSSVGDDFNFETNDLFVTVEQTYNIGFNGSAVYSCTGTV